MSEINFALPPEEHEDDMYETTRSRGGSSGYNRQKRLVLIIFIAIAVLAIVGVVAFMLINQPASSQAETSSSNMSVTDKSQEASASSSSAEVTIPSTRRKTTNSSSSSAATSSSSASSTTSSSSSAASQSNSAASTKPSADELKSALDLTEDYRASLVHGSKPKDMQKYIVLHDTESAGSAEDVVGYWDSSGNGVAAHFVINRDGSVVQCVALDEIAHHAGFGDAGHNAEFGVEDESHDDKVGTTPIGDAYPDYGMNSYSIGIEICHIGGEEDYTDAQLETLDALIAYIDAYYGGNAGRIIDHKTWRTTNSDTSAEFAEYFENYQNSRTHDGH